MRIIVFSDTHGRTKGMTGVLENMVGVDAVIHCGDGASDIKRMSENFPDIDFYYVNGNCDGESSNREKMIELGGKKFFVTHGDYYKVKSESEIEYPTLREEGRRRGADAVLFGHTHVAYNRNWGDIMVINPGCVEKYGTYSIIEIENGIMKSMNHRIF